MKPDLTFFDPGHHFPIPSAGCPVRTGPGVEVTREALLADKTPAIIDQLEHQDCTPVAQNLSAISQKDGKLQAPAVVLAARIAAEPEWQPSTAALRDAILRRFTERLDAICATAPDRLNAALAVVIQAGPGRTVLVISDPAAADFVTELRRHVEAGEPSPLTALLNSRLPI